MRWSRFDDVSTSISDGFRGTTKLSQECVVRHLSTGDIKLYYLHGSYLFVNTSNGTLFKRSARGNADKSIILSNTHADTPFLVLEPDAITKEEIISKHIYLSYCFNQLASLVGDLLVFGVSFLKDDHILRAIMKNPEIETVHIAFFKESDKEKIQEKLVNHTFKDYSQNIKFIQVGENVIWK